MSKKIAVFGIIFILALFFLYGYATNPQIQEFIASYTEEGFSDSNIYSDVYSITKRLDEEIMKGSDSFTIYLKDMDVEEVRQINASFDCVFGSGSTYQLVGAVGENYKKVTIMISRTSNYYAMRAYLNQEPIPDTDPKAKQLYTAIRQIMATYINDSMTDYEKEVALHDYLVENCQYSRDTSQPAGSDIYRAYGALVNKDAVCNGYAEALQLLFTCAGIESEFVIGTANGVEHAWNLVQLDGEWYHLDATWNDPVPNQEDVALHPYFNVTDELIANNHTWNRELYPEATGTDYNYYVYNELYFENFELYKDFAYKVLVNDRKSRFEAVVANYTENEKDMQFVFDDNDLYESVNWQTFRVEDDCVLVLQAK